MRLSNVKAPVFQEACIATGRTLADDFGIRVVFAGKEAKNDGKTITLPMLDQRMELDVEQQMIGAGYLDQEAAKAAFTDWESYNDQVEKAKGVPLLRDLIQSIEELRTEREFTKRFPGAKRNLGAVTEAVNKIFLEEDVVKNPDLAKDPAILPYMMTNVGRSRMGIARVSCDDAVAKISKAATARLESYVDEIDKCGSTKDVVKLAKKLHIDLMDNPPPMDDSGGGTPPPSGGKESYAPKGADFHSLLNIKHDPSKDAYIPFSTAWDVVIDKDHDEGAFLKDPRSIARYKDIIDNSGGAVGVMKRKIERALMAKQLRHYHGGQVLGRLDTKRLVRAVGGDPYVYKTRQDGEDIDTAVTLLVDCSGSMSGPKIVTAQKAAIYLANSIAAIGVPLEVLGFTAHPNQEMSEAVHKDKGEYSRIYRLSSYIFKGFAESLHQSKMGLGAISNVELCENYDGESVLLAWTRLRMRPEKRKILITLSDGMPAGPGSGGRSRVTLGQHLRDVINFVQKDGGEPVGIGIMSDAVKQFYPRYILLNGIEELAGAPMGQLAKLLLGERFQAGNEMLAVHAAA